MAQLIDGYQPRSSQPYQYRILIYEANGHVGHRNDHIIQVNPNIIMGTINPDQLYANPLQIDIQIDTSNQKLLNSAIINSDIIIYTLNSTNTQQFQYLLKLLKCSSFEKNKKVICISPIFNWGKKHPSGPYRQQDFPYRASINSAIKQLQNLCLSLSIFNSHLTGCVINSGLAYGMGEDILFSSFKQALQQKQNLKIYGRGLNSIPTIHVDDLSQFVLDIAFSKLSGMHFAVDHSTITQKELVESISQTLGNGKVEQLPIQNSFLHQYFDVFNSDITVDPKQLPNLSIWKYKDGIVKNMGAVVGQFNTSRGLRPNKILIHGPPASGKSKLAEILSKNYGLPILHIKGLIGQIMAEDSVFANQIKAVFEQLRTIRIEQERKIYQDVKKKKKGKGMDEFDPNKVVVRLGDNQIIKIIKRRISMADCLNKGYIIDGLLKNYAQMEAVFVNDGKISEEIFPNSVFSIEAAQQEVKDRVKKLPADVTEGTHLTEEQTIRRFALYNKQNQGKKWYSFFSDKVDILQVSFNYTDTNKFIQFVQRNGPLGFKVKIKLQQEKIGQLKEETEQVVNKKQVAAEEQQEESDRQQFDLQRLTANETKILNEKSRPIRQYLIDNVIPQITQGLLQICKQNPPDPIKLLIKFLQSKRKSKHKSVRKI